MTRRERFGIRDGEELVVDTRAHPIRLVAPMVRLWLVVLGYSALRRVLELSWRPVEQPWTGAHTVVEWALLALAVWLAVRWCVRPVWRWWATRFVLTDQRLALTGAATRTGVVSLPLAELRSVREIAPTGPVATLTRRVDRGTVIADFGPLGGLKLVACPRPGTLCELIRQEAGRATDRGRGHYSGAGVPSTSGAPRPFQLDPYHRGGPRG